jgi:hypothetical protein
MFGLRTGLLEAILGTFLKGMLAQVLDHCYKLTLWETQQGEDIRPTRTTFPAQRRSLDRFGKLAKPRPKETAGAFCEK